MHKFSPTCATTLSALLIPKLAAEPSAFPIVVNSFRDEYSMSEHLADEGSNVAQQEYEQTPNHLAPVLYRGPLITPLYLQPQLRLLNDRLRPLNPTPQQGLRTRPRPWPRLLSFTDHAYLRQLPFRYPPLCDSMAAYQRQELLAAAAAARAATKAATCQACSEEIDTSSGIVLDCGHGYHKECLNSNFRSTLKDRENFPPKCCGTREDGNISFIKYESVKTYLDTDIILLWEGRAEEWLSTDAKYCQTRSCSGDFIKQSQTQGQWARCAICGNSTCIVCKAAQDLHPDPGSHPSPLAPENQKLADEEGLQVCPNTRCGRLIEKIEGCDHMTCTCGTYFCYNCGEELNSRDAEACPCKHEESVDENEDEDEEDVVSDDEAVESVWESDWESDNNEGSNAPEVA